MPNRIVREGILDSKAIAALSDSGEIFYRRLISVVDDFGRYEADCELLRVKCFPRQLDRWPIVRVEAALAEVSRTLIELGVPLVLVYQVEGRVYLQVAKFDQRLRTKTKKYPDPVVRQLIEAVTAADSEARSSGGQEADTRGQHANVPFTSLPFRSASDVVVSSKNKVVPISSVMFLQFWERYPRKFGEESACRDWCSEVTTENELEVFACLDRYLASEEVRHGAVMYAGSTMKDTGWIVKCARDKWKSDWPRAREPTAPAVRLTASQIALQKAREQEAKDAASQ